MAAYYWVDQLIFGSYECPTCGRSKPRSSEHFHRDAQATDGLTRECKSCRCRRDKRRWRGDAALRERRLAQMREAREARS